MNDSKLTRAPLIALFIYLFAVLYGPSIGPVPSIYFSAAFPLSHSEIVGPFTICVQNSLGSTLGLTFPALLTKVGPTWAFGLYADLNILALSVIFFIVPETKQLSLEQFDYVIGVPPTKHASYQLQV